MHDMWISFRNGWVSCDFAKAKQSGETERCTRAQARAHTCAHERTHTLARAHTHTDKHAAGARAAAVGILFSQAPHGERGSGAQGSGRGVISCGEGRSGAVSGSSSATFAGWAMRAATCARPHARARMHAHARMHARAGKPAHAHVHAHALLPRALARAQMQRANADMGARNAHARTLMHARAHSGARARGYVARTRRTHNALESAECVCWCARMLACA